MAQKSVLSTLNILAVSPSKKWLSSGCQSTNYDMQAEIIKLKLLFVLIRTDLIRSWTSRLEKAENLFNAGDV